MLNYLYKCLSIIRVFVSKWGSGAEYASIREVCSCLIISKLFVLSVSRATKSNALSSLTHGDNTVRWCFQQCYKHEIAPLNACLAEFVHKNRKNDSLFYIK